METFILIFYFLSLTVLFAFGMHGLFLLYYYRKYRNAKIEQPPLPDELPMVTVQIPLFNEMYVAERIVHTVCKLNYPKEKLEIQVLDDSTDQTQDILKPIVADYQAKGYNIKYIHRTNRQGFKAGDRKSVV